VEHDPALPAERALRHLVGLEETVG